MATALQLVQLVQLPCSCGCGQTAATIRVTDLPDELQGLVSSALSVLRIMSRTKVLKIPDGTNPLLHIPPDVLSNALGIVRPECVSAALELAGVGAD